MSKNGFLKSELAKFDSPNQEDVDKKRETELDDIEAVLRLPQGRRFIARILSKGHLSETTFTGNSHTFKNEGERSLALWILKEIKEASPESFIEMIKDGQLFYF